MIKILRIFSSDFNEKVGSARYLLVDIKTSMSH